MPPAPKPCTPVPCEPTEAKAVRVWFASVVHRDGRRGSVMVNAIDWREAGNRAVTLSGASLVTLRAETFLVDDVQWDDD